MKRFHKLIGILLSLTMITLISGCGGSSSSSDTTLSSTPSANVETGVMSLSITDGIPQLPGTVKAVNIRVIGIEFKYNDEWTDVTDFENNDFIATTLNLYDLRYGGSLHLGDFKVPAGDYKEIRFKLAAPVKEEDVKSNPDCNITFTDAPTVPLFVPSGAETQSGYKAKGEFHITANAKLEITADFDLDKSIVVTGSGKYLLKPVIRIVVNELSGWINGTVLDVNIDEYTDDEVDEVNALYVYAYKDNNNYIEGDEEENSGGIRFSNAVSSTDVNMTDGNFTLAFLGEGNYSLVTAHYITDEFQKVVDVEDDVEVLKGQGTLNIELNTSDWPPTP